LLCHSAWRLLWDFQLLRGLVDEMPRDGPLQNKALWVANKIQDTFRQDDPATIGECRRIAQEVLGKDWDKLEEGVYEQGNRKDRDDTALWSLGHCHIDVSRTCAASVIRSPMPPRLSRLRGCGLVSATQHLQHDSPWAYSPFSLGHAAKGRALLDNAARSDGALP
jgi:hypothetical protein